ncbi:MAG: response regulator [Syntrophobacteraceae bacterium]
MRTSRILIVEDEAIVSMAIAERLQKMGYQTVGRATNGEQCLKLVELQRPDLVLMDIRIKGAMDGIATAERVRKSFQTPVIFLTAYSEEATIERAKLAEPYAYIFKPIEDRELRSAIEIALYRHRADEEIRRLNRLYDVLSQVNQSFFRTRSQEEMLAEVCRLIVQRGGVDLAWIGWLDPATSRVTPAVHFGTGSEMLLEVHYAADENPEHQGNPGRAILEGKPSVCNDCVAGLCPFPMVNAPAIVGYRSCGSFPLRFQGGVRGVLTLCTGEADFFGEREIHLFEELACDTSFALEKLEGDAERERMERALRESNERLGAFFERARDAILIADPESGIILEANAEAENLLGRPRSEIVGVHFTRVHPPEGEKRYREGFLMHSGTSQLERIEAEILRPDGTQVPVEVSGGLIDLGNGQQVVQGIFRDITERRLAEEEANRQRETLIKVFESAPIIMMIVDQELRIRNINCTGANFSRRPQEDLLNLLCGEVFDCFNAFEGNGCGTNPSCTACALRSTVTRTFKTGESIFDVESRMAVLRGSMDIPVDILISTALVKDRTSDLVLVTILDITERKRAEQEREKLEAQLREAQKLEAIGTLAGGIAHDFNNILAPIIGYTEIALEDTPAADPQRDFLEQVLKAANRAKELVRQILAFSRHEQEKPMIPMNIGTIVKEALNLLRATLPSTIEIRRNVERGFAVADGIQIHQMVVNLCTNAAHATEGGGILRVSLKEIVLHNGDLDVFAVPDLEPGHYLRLSVADSGHGMDPETIQRIFEPYFTTKEVGKGTGLGLSVVHGIVKRHRGKIVVQSELGRGSVFDVYLPSAQEKSAKPASIIESLPRGSERILLVDDEEMVAQMAAKMLTRLGYTVISQTSPIEALKSFYSNPQAFDLIISDFTMPGMTGIDLAQKIRVARADVPVILCTGFNERLLEENARDLGIQEIAFKPLERSQLAELVRRTLDRRKV